MVMFRCLKSYVFIGVVINIVRALIILSCKVFRRNLHSILFKTLLNRCSRSTEVVHLMCFLAKQHTGIPHTVSYFGFSQLSISHDNQKLPNPEMTYMYVGLIYYSHS